MPVEVATAAFGAFQRGQARLQLRTVGLQMRA